MFGNTINGQEPVWGSTLTGWTQCAAILQLVKSQRGAALSYDQDPVWGTVITAQDPMWGSIIF
jgi:hypothetical protein